MDTSDLLVNEMRARTILESEMSTLVIHMDDRSTDFLKPIYDGRGYQVITGSISEREAVRLIKAHARVFMLGHGGPGGLFTRGFYADDQMGSLLAEKEDGLYIWCNADAYAHRNKLTGLCSGMFISEVGEARMFGIQATQQEVDASNAFFSKTVREVFDGGHPHSTVRERYTHATDAITKFNQERLYVFEKGQPTPALHATSQAHSYGQWKNHPRHAPAEQHAPAQEPAYDEQAEVKGLVGFAVADVLDGLMTPEHAAEELLRHTNVSSEETFDLVVDILRKAMTDTAADQDMIEQQVLDAIFG